VKNWEASKFFSLMLYAWQHAAESYFFWTAS